MSSAVQHNTTSRVWAILPAVLLAIAGIAAYLTISANVVMNGHLTFEEVNPLIKGWWYITGALGVFGNGDTASTLPGYPLALGALEKAVGLSITSARVAMVALGLVNGALLYLLCRRLTANTLASAAAVFLFLGSPATAYSFSTATPVAFVALLFLLSLWVMLLSLGRPRVVFTILMGLLLAALILTDAAMWIPSLLLGAIFIAAVGRQRLVHSAILLATVTAALGAVIAILPDRFLTYLLSQPLPLLILNGLSMTPIGAGAAPQFTLANFVQNIVDGAFLPYAGTITLCVILLALTIRGPRILWAIPLYFVAALAAIAVFTVPGCETCAATAPSQLMALGALGAAISLALLSRWRRQKRGTGAPVIIGFATIALALNCFASGLATQETLRFFPAEAVKQARPAAEQQDISALMRVVGENIPGTERVLLLHNAPGVPYAVHMAGRRFSAVSINPMRALRALPPTQSTSQREALLALIERNGGWSGETLRRWVDREYDVIVLQDGLLALDPATTETLTTEFEIVTVTDFRGVRLTIYKRKA
jgi:hypothetical protein